MARRMMSRMVVSLSLACACGACLAQATATDRFNLFDRNHDGVVSKGEFNSDAAFSVMDSNHDNRISATELQAVLGPQEDGAYSAADRIRNADRNGDGELTDEELRRGAETRFQWLDRNQDGNVDLAEMKSGFGVPVGH